MNTLITETMEAVKDQIVSKVSGLHWCPGCKKQTKQTRVKIWIERLGRYCRASSMRCNECGTHWDYL